MSQERLRVGVVGTGSMGRHHVRILAAMPQADLVGIYDLRPEVAAELAAKHGTESFSSVERLAQQTDAIVLAVPTFAHCQLGCKLLSKGKHLMVEKPMAPNLAEADRLLAAAGDRVLAVGHVEFFNPAVQTLLDQAGGSRFVEMQRLSPFTPRSLDVDVVLDLMIHDLQILHALDPSPVREIRSSGVAVLSPRVDLANARIELESGLVANITASRVSAEPVRKLRVFQDRRYLSIDYRQQEIKGYGLEESGEEKLIVPLPLKVEHREPLVGELHAFVDACLGRRSRYVDGAQGRRALATALTVLEGLG